MGERAAVEAGRREGQAMSDLERLEELIKKWGKNERAIKLMAQTGSGDGWHYEGWVQLREDSNNLWKDIKSQIEIIAGVS